MTEFEIGWKTIKRTGKNWNTSGPSVSLVIPCYNRSVWLRQTLSHVAGQTHRPLEIILVDDGSEEDLSEAITSGLESFDGPWQWVRLEKNSGPGMARKLGHTLAKGKYVHFLDSDDRIHPEKIKRQVECLEGHPDWVMTYAFSVYEYPDREKAVQKKLGRTHLDFRSILPESLNGIIWTTSSCLWRNLEPHRKYWKPLYGPEDILFDLFVGLENRPIGKTPGEDPLLFKQEHETNISKNLAENHPFQCEILKAYDYFWEAGLKPRNDALYRPRLAEKYAGKIMTFLVLRDHPRVNHCLDRIAEIDPSAMPRDAWLARRLKGLFGESHSYAGLRKWRWLKKIKRRLPTTSSSTHRG